MLNAESINDADEYNPVEFFFHPDPYIPYLLPAFFMIIKK